MYKLLVLIVSILICSCAPRAGITVCKPVKEVAVEPAPQEDTKEYLTRDQVLEVCDEADITEQGGRSYHVITCTWDWEASCGYRWEQWSSATGENVFELAHFYRKVCK
jgi:hypothetical protein